MGMNDTEVLQLVTLWFVILTYSRMGAGSSDGSIVIATNIVATFLVYLIPLYLLGNTALRFLRK